MEGILHGQVRDPIVDEILRLQGSHDVRESALEHYRIANAFIEAVWTVAQALSRIPSVFGVVLARVSQLRR